MKRSAPPSERRELHCGTVEECTAFLQMTGKPDDFEIVANSGPGPAASVYRKRKPFDPTIKAPIRRQTRGTVRVQGVSSNHNRPLWVSFEPGDVITFCPVGTRQKVTVPLLSLYHHARFISARAVANAKRAQKKGGKR